MAINEMRSIATFIKAVEFGSLRKAGRALGISPQAAGRGIAHLEAHLGVRLLQRTTRSLVLTAEGRRFLEASQPVLTALEQAISRTRTVREEISGPLRIVVPRSSVSMMLIPVLGEFCRKHPGVQPSLHLDDGRRDWVSDNMDVGFRIGAPPEGGVIAHKLLPVQMVICAAPNYIQQHGVPRTLDDLVRHRCSAFRHTITGQTMPWYLNIGGEVVHRHVASVLSANDAEFLLHCALAGQVISQVPTLSAASHIREGRLVPLLLQYMSDHMGLHLYYDSRVTQPPTVRSFIKLVIENLSNSPDHLLAPQELAVAAGRVFANAARNGEGAAPLDGVADQDVLMLRSR